MKRLKRKKLLRPRRQLRPLLDDEAEDLLLVEEHLLREEEDLLPLEEEDLLLLECKKLTVR